VNAPVSLNKDVQTGFALLARELPEKFITVPYRRPQRFFHIALMSYISTPE
jgi:hypothetical protein